MVGMNKKPRAYARGFFIAGIAKWAFGDAKRN